MDPRITKFAKSLMTSPFVLEVKIGKKGAKPTKGIPGSLAAALVSAEINLSDTAPSGFQLVFGTQPSSDDNDYGLMKEDLLKEFSRVHLDMHVGTDTTRLMDGYITLRELDPEAGRVVITGEDLSVKMDLFEVSWEYKDLKDSEIVSAILGRYSSVFTKKTVKARDGESKPDAEKVPRQLDTDRRFLSKLAARNDRLFYVKFDGEDPEVYWGPREQEPEITEELIANTPTFANVEKMTPKYDSLAKVLYYGAKLVDGDDGKEEETTAQGATKLELDLAKSADELEGYADLSADPESFYEKLSELNIRGKYIRHQSLSNDKLGAAAESESNRKGSEAAAIEGELDSGKYGAVLTVPGKVGVRGLGTSFDGSYLVQSVTHSINFRGDVKYMQKFKLTREGLESTEGSVGS